MALLDCRGTRQFGRYRAKSRHWVTALKTMKLTLNDTSPW